MDNFNNIQNKLEQFIKRYHTNELLKGAILFFAIGLLYFLFTLLIEHFLWLNTTARTLLFWLFILVEITLLVTFIVIPLAKLFKLKRGIDYNQSAKIIGQHFPEVKDKLLNVIQLNGSTDKSDLLLASIDQKSKELKPIPFKLAVNFKKNLSYLKYAIIPVAIVLLIYFTGNFNWFSDSYKRVVDYNTAYEPPAPFQFYVINDSLSTIQRKDFKLQVRTVGDLVPENVLIKYNNESYFLQQNSPGEFEYVFSQPTDPIVFNFSANNVNSKPYTLSIVDVPSISTFNMHLDYPSYVNKRDEILKTTGNATVPEGTKITWQIKANNTDHVNLYAIDTLQFYLDDNDAFKASKRVFRNYEYTLSTSNKKLKDYENLEYAINVVKDEYPELNIQVKKDSLDLQSLYFYGQVSDDYGLSKVQLVYYPSGKEDEKQVKVISSSGSNVFDFINAFPDTINVEEGIAYELYFQAFDNDAVNKFKSVKSSVFTYRKRTKKEEEEKQLNQQGESIKDLGKSIKKFKEQEKRLEELSKTGKEKRTLNFSDKKKLESFIKRQKQQDQMMRNFNKKLKENLEDFQKEKNKEDNAYKKDLEKRLQENEEQLKKDEKALEELEKLKDKINNEKLTQKLEELAKNSKSKKRSLEQLLELTKRFYVEKKLEKLADDLKELAKKQEELSNKNEKENTKEKQDSINKAFEAFQKAIEDLKKDSKALKKPIAIPQDKLEEKEVQEEQKKASDALDKKEQSGDPQEKKESQEKAKKSQKNAAKKMKQMSGKMQGAMQGMSGDQIQEDAEMLRQILDNLVLFSFDEEALMDQFKAIDVNHNKYASFLRKQSNLKEHFEHIDDSLFTLSLRQPKLSEQVNKEISEVYFNIDQSLELLAENQLYQGVSKQQFAITATNNLADLLSDILDNMQESMSMSPSQGGEGDMQLPDIIMSQEELNKMMQQGMKKGEQGQPKQGEGKQKGDGEKQGDKKGNKEGDKPGDKGKGGKKGKGDKGKSEGDNGNKSGSNGEGEGGSQEALLYEIYKRQQMLREALEQRLDKEGKGGIGDKLSKQMKDVELDLLNKGFTNQTLSKMMNLQHQLLKLENAELQQGEDNKRESKTNKKVYDNSATNQIPTAKQYFKTTEILNRQALPLQKIYKKKVQEYFKK